MKTLHELAIKLQDYIIKSQSDAHNETNMNVTKYNNLKLKMETRHHYPNIIVCIGISEATFNIADGTKTDGGLGPDEKYVRKWLGSSTVIADLKEIWIAMSDLIKAEDEDKAISMEGEADEVKKEAPRKKKFRELLDIAMPTNPLDAEETDEDSDDESPGLMTLEESTHQTEKKEVPDDEPETVEEVKKGLKDYLKAMFRRL